MDEALAFKRPKKTTVLEGATIGVGVLVSDSVWEFSKQHTNLRKTAALGIIEGTNIEFSPNKVEENSEWLIVLGGAGAVGQYSIQVCMIEFVQYRGLIRTRSVSCVAIRFSHLAPLPMTA